VIGTTWRLLARYPLPFLAAAGGMAAFDTTLDAVAPDSAIMIVSSAISIGVIYVVFRLLLRQEDMVAREGSFASYFGVSMLSGLAVVAGLLLLIVPGFYLMGRWSVASAMVVARGLQTTEAMRASWRATEGCAWKLALLYGLCIGLLIAVVVALSASTGALAVLLGSSAEAVDTSLSFQAAFNLLANFAGVGTAYLAVAIYRHVVSPDREFEAIFS
jgi:hypothetical protein